MTATIKEILIQAQSDIQRAIDAIDAMPLPPVSHQLELNSENLAPGKMGRHIIYRVITTNLPSYIEKHPRYQVSHFRRHCQSLLSDHFKREDVEPDHSGYPKWYGRFNYAHKQEAEIHGLVTDGNGVYAVSKDRL